MKPYEVEILVGEVDGDASGTAIYHILFDGSVTDEHGFVAIGGHAEDLMELLKDRVRRGLGSGDGGRRRRSRCSARPRAATIEAGADRGRACSTARRSHRRKFRRLDERRGRASFLAG